MYIETERLILRRWSKNDVKPFAEINSHPDVMVLLCSGQQKLATALEFFQNNLSDSFGVKPPLY